jgi:hypothetical protein
MLDSDIGTTENRYVFYARLHLSLRTSISTNFHHARLHLSLRTSISTVGYHIHSADVNLC